MELFSPLLSSAVCTDLGQFPLRRTQPRRRYYRFWSSTSFSPSFSSTFFSATLPPMSTSLGLPDCQYLSPPFQRECWPSTGFFLPVSQLGNSPRATAGAVIGLTYFVSLHALPVIQCLKTIVIYMYMSIYMSLSIYIYIYAKWFSKFSKAGE